jgi:hypothetical protein
LPTLPPILNDVSPPPFEQEEGEASSIENEYLTADEGYEADAELMDRTSAIEMGSQMSVCPKNGGGAFSRPELCSLVVSLLIKLHMDDAPDSTLDPSLVHAFQKLIYLCMDSPQNCVILTNHGVIEALLKGELWVG